MTLPEGFPSLSELRAANWDYLGANAKNWTELADTWENAFTEIYEGGKRPGGTEWTGPAAEAFEDRTYADLVKVRGPAEELRTAAGIATRGADAQEAGKRLALDAVDDAERDGFAVEEDYTPVSIDQNYGSMAEYEARQAKAAEHEEFIKYRVANLVTGENDLARQLTTATEGLHHFHFPDEGEDGGTAAVGVPQTATLVDDVLRRGESRNLGPVAGTGANPGVPNMGGADLGEVITLPNGKQVMIVSAVT